jgi:hypothetical protein
MKLFFRFIVVLPVIMLFMLSCSEKSSGLAVASPIQDNGLKTSSETPGAHSLLGIYSISIDPVSLEADVIPMRVGEGHLNALKFLEEGPCSFCLAVTNIQPHGPKEFLIDIQVTHPLFGLDQFTVFDVRGIIMFDPGFVFPASGLSFPDPLSPGAGYLINPDGYTTLFNPTDFPPGSMPWKAWEYQKGKYATPDFPASTLNAYLAYCETIPRRYLGCTSADTRTYDMKFPNSGPLHFGYAIDCNWAPPTQNPPVVPDDFPLIANVPEPYHLEMQITENSLWSDSGGGSGGNLRFGLKVYDHQDPHLVANGGTIQEFKIEIAGMTDWENISPSTWSEGVDSMGDYVKYDFLMAPIPDAPGPHNCVIAVIDKEIGLKSLNETAYCITDISVNQGETCWSPGVLLSDIPNESYQAHLNNMRNLFVDSYGIVHLYYLDTSWYIHHLIYDGIVQSDEIIIPGEQGYNLNAVPDNSGDVHLLYSNNPDILGGDIIYRKISSAGDIGPAVKLNSDTDEDQYQSVMAIAPSGEILALWMDTENIPTRYLLGAYFNGSTWSPEINFVTCDLPENWINPAVVADSSNAFHITYTYNTPADIYYLSFANGVLSQPQEIIGGPQKSVAGNLSIDSNDKIYMTFEDDRTGSLRGYLTMRDPVTGVWSPEIDISGYNHQNNRYQNEPLPGGRLGVVWTDWRDDTRGLYSKVFDPMLSQDDILAIPDEEIDGLFTDIKNQTRLCADQNGTLHLVWSDIRSGHWQLYYSKCTP